MKFPFYIAFRYLFSPKKHSAINIISLICAIGVCIGTMALVCILSVYNGFQDLIGGTFSQLDPDLRISKVEGKTFGQDEKGIKEVKQLPFVAQHAFVLEENAVVKCGDRQTWVTIKGVNDNYRTMFSTDQFVKEGRFLLSNGDTEFGLLGLTTAIKLNASLYVPKPLEIYAPKREGNIQVSNPENAFNQEDVYLAGIYSVEQEETDGRYMMVSLHEAQRLFGYEKSTCSAFELKVKPGTDIGKAKAAISQQLGSSFKVEDKKEQHKEFYRMLKVEKWISFLILAFILLIAILNVTGSLSMLIIEKKNDIGTLRNLGATNSTISNIFLLEGWMVTAIGALIGTIVGLLLCLAQQKWGFISLGGGDDSGLFLTNAYPVKIEVGDVLATLTTVLLLGLFVAWIPTRMLRNTKN